MAAYTTIDNPELYFQVKTYSGNGSAGHAITLDGEEDMQPDLVWQKRRNDTNYHVLYDSVRGATKYIYSNTNGAENTNANGLTAFGSNGFTLGNDGDANHSSGTHVAWCWKAGAGSGSANTDGGINTTSTSVSQTAGFSISTWTGTGSNATVGHGLNAVPKLIITKARSHSYDWYTYHASIGNTKNIYLNLTNAESGASANFHNNTDPTSSVWTAGGNIYNDTYTFVTYAFAEKQGFSKFGSYTGNGNADGAFIYTGFRPAFLIIKKSSATEDWGLIDNKRDPNNDGASSQLFPNGSNVEDSSNDRADLLSNGFKLRTSSGQWNASGATYVYMAFAEQPFVNSKGVPANSR